MNTEPLKTILDLTNNKQDSIVFFLSDNVKSQLNNYYLYDKQNKDIFINQYIICVKKNNLQIEVKGKIISINNDNICISINNIYNKYVNISQYYTFLKNSKSKSNDRDFLKIFYINLDKKSIYIFYHRLQFLVLISERILLIS